MKEYAGKILIIVQNLPVPFDRRVWLESKTLRDAGYKVSVISPKSSEFSKSFELLEGISIYRYMMPIDANGVLGYLFEFIFAWLATAYLSVRVLRREGFDVIHACNPPDTYFLLGLIYKFLGKKFVFDHHDMAPEMFTAKFGKKNGLLYKGLVLLEKMTMKTASIVISTNNAYRDVAIIRNNKKPSDVWVVRTGPDLTRLKILPSNPGLKNNKPFMVCYLGEMCPQDGVDYLLYAIQHILFDIGREDIMFNLVGGGPALSNMRDLSTRLELDDYVKFTGRISDQELCQYLSAADICVDPDPYSEWADSSTMNKILEYMVFSKPIVTFDLKETRYSAQDAAIYVKPNNVKEFARAIDILLDDPIRRKYMGEYGRKRVLTQLSWSKNKQNLIKAYQKIFQQNRTNRCNDKIKTLEKPISSKKCRKTDFESIQVRYKQA
jgi:glycosyltransferase involved in cell wall biosynthesis